MYHPIAALLLASPNVVRVLPSELLAAGVPASELGSNPLVFQWIPPRMRLQVARSVLRFFKAEPGMFCKDGGRAIKLWWAVRCSSCAHMPQIRVTMPGKVGVASKN